MLSRIDLYSYAEYHPVRLHRPPPATNNSIRPVCCCIREHRRRIVDDAPCAVRACMPGGRNPTGVTVTRNFYRGNFPLLPTKFANYIGREFVRAATAGREREENAQFLERGPRQYLHCFRKHVRLLTEARFKFPSFSDAESSGNVKIIAALRGKCTRRAAYSSPRLSLYL